MRKLSLDSSFVIAYLSRKEEARFFLERAEYDEVLIPSVARMEVKWGNPDISRFEELPIIDYDGADADRTVRLGNYLEERGKMINRLDLMIAAQTVNAGATIVTRDADFSELEGVSGFKAVNFEEKAREFR
jgi:predicted nucleic acid-binding protein